MALNLSRDMQVRLIKARVKRKLGEHSNVS